MSLSDWNARIQQSGFVNQPLSEIRGCDCNYDKQKIHYKTRQTAWIADELHWTDWNYLTQKYWHGSFSEMETKYKWKPVLLRTDLEKLSTLTQGGSLSWDWRVRSPRYLTSVRSLSRSRIRSRAPYGSRYSARVATFALFLQITARERRALRWRW